MDIHQNLLAYLTQKNPEVDASKAVKGRNTTSVKEAWKEPARIVEWRDFQPQSLFMSFEGRLDNILKTKLAGPVPGDIPAFPFREVYDEDSLETLLILWTQQIVSNALAIAQDQLPTICSYGRVYMARGGQAQFLTAFPKSRKRRNSFPDWAAVRRAESPESPHTRAANILPGDTKISSKWKSADLELGDRATYNANPDSAKPVLQVYNYCLKANVRYGYIITDHELVVLRIRTLDEIDAGIGQETLGESQESQELYASEGQRRARQSSEVELKSIPWNLQNQNPEALTERLTINLALWWLHLMAAARCSIDSSYPSLCDEILPPDPTSSISFSTEIANINLGQSASFASDASGPGESRRKRKRIGPDVKATQTKRRQAK